jgi:hypothetical protein
MPDMLVSLTRLPNLDIARPCRRKWLKLFGLDSSNMLLDQQGPPAERRTDALARLADQAPSSSRADALDAIDILCNASVYRTARTRITHAVRESMRCDRNTSSVRWMPPKRSRTAAAAGFAHARHRLVASAEARSADNAETGCRIRA